MRTATLLLHLLMHYTLVELKEKENGDTKTLSTKKFTVSYTVANSQIKTTKAYKLAEVSR